MKVILSQHRPAAKRQRRLRQDTNEGGKKSKKERRNEYTYPEERRLHFAMKPRDLAEQALHLKPDPEELPPIVVL
jgi:hypothetical protein